MTSTYENRPVYNERRVHARSELEALRPGTIFIVHANSADEVWMKVDDFSAQQQDGTTHSVFPMWGFALAETTLLAVNTVRLAEFIGKDKIRIFLNKNLNWSKGKRAAHAAHTALIALGVHPGTAITVLEASPTNINKMDVLTHDNGQTELAPGTLTGGTDFLKEEESL